MTCIAYDGKIIAADSMVLQSPIVHDYNKLFALSNGRVAASAGYLGNIDLFHAWMVNEFQGPKPDYSADTDHFTTMVVKLDCPVLLYYNGCPNSRIHAVKYYAIGCYWTMAIGAMEAGASAVEAIKIVAKHTNDVNSVVHWYNLATERGGIT